MTCNHTLLSGIIHYCHYYHKLILRNLTNTVGLSGNFAPPLFLNDNENTFPRPLRWEHTKQKGMAKWRNKRCSGIGPESAQC